MQLFTKSSMIEEKARNNDRRQCLQFQLLCSSGYLCRWFKYYLSNNKIVILLLFYVLYQNSFTCPSLVSNTLFFNTAKMDQYPTEEEEYELMYGDDLDAMNDMEVESKDTDLNLHLNHPPTVSDFCFSDPSHARPIHCQRDSSGPSPCVDIPFALFASCARQSQFVANQWGQSSAESSIFGYLQELYHYQQAFV